jgi:hypothetical protein
MVLWQIILRNRENYKREPEKIHLQNRKKKIDKSMVF